MTRPRADIHLAPANSAVSEFAFQTRKAAFGEYASHGAPWDEDEERRQHDRRFGAGGFWIILAGDRRMGVLLYREVEGALHLHQLFVLPEFQGRGVGEACVRDVIALGLPIQLRVLKANPRAFAFYRRLGFELVEETDSHWIMERPALIDPGAGMAD